MQNALNDYQNMVNQLVQQMNARQAQVQQNQQQTPRHTPLNITAERFINDRDDANMKMLTNFTVPEFIHLYGFVDKALKEGSHSNALVSPQTRFLLTLTWCKFNETYKPMAMKFGLKYTYARQIVTSTIHIAQPILERIFIKWTSVPARLAANIQVADYQYLLGSVDATVQRVYRPSVGQRNYYSGKHKMHCIKTQAFVSPSGLLMHHSHCIPGAQHDMSLFRDSGLKDLIAKENAECQRTLNVNCTVLGDSGYQGLAHEIVGGITPHKKPRGGELTAQEQHENGIIGHHRIIVENWFGRHKALWSICAGTFRQNHKLYECTWGFCAALTNYHITIHPLRADEHMPWDDPPDDEDE